MLTLIIITAIFMYIFFGIVIGNLWYFYFTKKCGCYKQSWGCGRDHESGAVFTGMFWPVAPLIVLAAVCIYRLAMGTVSLFIEK